MKETVDAFHRGRFHVVQPKGIGHRSGVDAMLLASLVDADGPVSVVDFGAGAGAAGLAVASRLSQATVLQGARSGLMAAYARKPLTWTPGAAGVTTAQATFDVPAGATVVGTQLFDALTGGTYIDGKTETSVNFPTQDTVTVTFTYTQN